MFGDMLLTPQQLSRYIENGSLLVRGVSRKESPHNRWKDNLVPFAISPQYTSAQKQMIRTSLKSMEAISCFRFSERIYQKDYVFIVPLDGCYSYVGRIGGGQLMSLAPECLADFIIWHEMMHAIGFEHEHQRPDRDTHLTVKYENVIPAQMTNFEKIRAQEVDYPDQYDYKSLMHYDSYAFGKMDKKKQVRLATMVPKKAGVYLGDNMKFSETDIRKLNRLGKCSPFKVTRSPTATTTNGELCYDRLKNCEDFVEAGKCISPGYKSLMETYCAKSCEFCKENAVTPTKWEMTTLRPNTPKIVNPILKEERKPFDEKKNSVEIGMDCTDLKQTCPLFADSCDNPAYKALLKKHCPFTCGYCQ
ncbi:unnamed protein product, partial [Mesorhabditis belari]|uniref:Metalloendopeptidase n=1 Tax=Mesorhabditis belari TaxID=2138241 RepID=A0AAF3ERS6_9BILA